MSLAYSAALSLVSFLFSFRELTNFPKAFFSSGVMFSFCGDTFFFGVIFVILWALFSSHSSSSLLSQREDRLLFFLLLAQPMDSMVLDWLGTAFGFLPLVMPFFASQRRESCHRSAIFQFQNCDYNKPDT